jgi:predicted ATPase
MTTKSVFLSYGRGDDEAFVREMWQYLTDKGIFAWFDRENLPSRGEAFTNEIARGIEASERLILFIGAHSAKSEWCEREWRHALKHCIPVVVVLVQHTFDGKNSTPKLPSDIKSKFPDELFAVNGLEFPPTMRDNAPQKLYDLLTNAENLPLANITFGEPLPTHYINRPNYLRDMKIALGVGDRTSKQATQLAGYQGIGGIGKTILASALVHECDTRRTFDYIFWLTLGETATINDATSLLYRIGEFFGDANDDYTDPDKARLAVERHLRNHRTLIVLDDAWKDTQDLIHAFQFNTIDCRVLITTRSINLLNMLGARVIPVDKLTLDEGLALISTVKRYANDAEKAIYDEIFALLDGHALAVQLTAQQLHDYDADGVLRRLKKNLLEANPFADLELADDDRNASLERSLQLSYGDLGGDLQRRFRALGVFAVNSRYGLNPLKTMWGDEDEDDAEDYAVKLRHVGLLNRIDGNYIRFGHHVLLTTYARALLMREGEYDDLFNQYTDFYTRRADEVFSTPPQDWHDNDEGSPNADDILNIKSLGIVLMTHTPNDTQDNLCRTMEFAYATAQYVNKRMEAKAWVWLEMGLYAVQILRKHDADDQTLLRRESLLLGELGTVYRALGQMKKALVYIEQSLPLARALGDKKMRRTN